MQDETLFFPKCLIRRISEPKHVKKDTNGEPQVVGKAFRVSENDDGMSFTLTCDRNVTLTHIVRYLEAWSQFGANPEVLRKKKASRFGCAVLSLAIAERFDGFSICIDKRKREPYGKYHVLGPDKKFVTVWVEDHLASLFNDGQIIAPLPIRDPEQDLNLTLA